MDDKENTEMSVQDRVKEITDKIEQGVKDVFTSERFTEYLNTLAKFHHYSLNNTILINSQCPGATLVAGYKQWQKDFERHVSKGEKAIKILAPSYFKVKKERDQLDAETGTPVLGPDGKPKREIVEVKVTTFRQVPVFDVSQTEGKDLPINLCPSLTDSVDGFDNFVKAIKEVSPVPISFKDIEGGAKGYYDLTNKCIVVQEGMSESHTVKTLVHEVTHSMLHADNPKAAPEDKKDRGTMEVQAEATAYTVCQHFGIETSDYSFDYIATWSSGREVEELKSSLNTIRETASKIITGIEARLLEMEREKDNTLSDENAMSVINRFKDAGVPFVETELLDMGLVEESLKGVADTLDSFNIPLSSLKQICGREQISNGGVAFADGCKDLGFLNRYYAPGAVHSQEKLYVIGAHEAGHVIVRTLLEQSFSDKPELERAEMWKGHKIESAILNEAKARYSSNPPISKYGSSNSAEKIAEAIADVMAYKSGNEYSQVIVDVIKEHLENPEKEYEMKKERKKSRGR